MDDEVDNVVELSALLSLLSIMLNENHYSRDGVLSAASSSSNKTTACYKRVGRLNFINPCCRSSSGQTFGIP